MVCHIVSATSSSCFSSNFPERWGTFSKIWYALKMGENYLTIVDVCISRTRTQTQSSTLQLVQSAGSILIRRWFWLAANVRWSPAVGSVLYNLVHIPALSERVSNRLQIFNSVNRVSHAAKASCASISIVDVAFYSHHASSTCVLTYFVLAFL